MDDIDASFPTGGLADAVIAEGSATALGVLALVNEASFEILDEDVPLDVRAVRGIWDVRNGPDDVMDSGDDGEFSTLAQLDAVPWIGPVSLQRLVDYAREHSYIPSESAPCRPGTLVVAGDDIVGDTEWAECQIDVWATNLVTEESTLRIRPGATVRFHWQDSGGASRLDVDGRLLAIGTSELPITFTMDDDWSALNVRLSGAGTELHETRWYGAGLLAQDGATADITHSRFVGDASATGEAITVRSGAEVTVQGTLFEQLDYAGIVGHDGSLELVDTVIRNSNRSIHASWNDELTCGYTAPGLRNLRLEHVDIVEVCRHAFRKYDRVVAAPLARGWSASRSRAWVRVGSHDGGRYVAAS